MVGCFAALLGACSVPNPAFDPPRKNDTDSLPSDDDGGETTLPMTSTDGGEDTTPADETGSIGGLCNDIPQEQVGFRIFREGTPIQRCGAVTERECTLARNEAEMRWELSGPECCLEDQFCSSNTLYVLEFGPTGPDVSLDPMEVSLRFSFTPADMGCRLDWVEIAQRTGVPLDVPPLVYMAAGGLHANDVVSVTAAPGEPLPNEVCECAESDADCCPDGLGRHTLHVSLPSGIETLDPATMPTATVQLGDTGVSTEVILVRSWQPPICGAPPEYQWIARRYGM